MRLWAHKTVMDNNWHNGSVHYHIVSNTKSRGRHRWKGGHCMETNWFIHCTCLKVNRSKRIYNQDFIAPRSFMQKQSSDDIHFLINFRMLCLYRTLRTPFCLHEIIDSLEVVIHKEITLAIADVHEQQDQP